MTSVYDVLQPTVLFLPVLLYLTLSTLTNSSIQQESSRRFVEKISRVPGHSICIYGRCDGWLEEGQCYSNFQKEQEEGFRKLLALSHAISGKGMEWVILEVTTKHGEEKEFIRSSQNGFTKGWITCQQYDSLLWPRGRMGQRGKSSGCYLPQ